MTIEEIIKSQIAVNSIQYKQEKEEKPKHILLGQNAALNWVLFLLAKEDNEELTLSDFVFQRAEELKI